MAKNRTIGNNGDIPWHIPADFKHFKALTLGKPVIMGRGTFHSIGNKPLPGRLNIILTKSKIEDENVVCFSSLKKALVFCEKEVTSVEVAIIGGQLVYQEGLEYANKIYLTEIELEFEGDTFFPELNNCWKLTKQGDLQTCEKNGLKYRFNEYNRA